MTAEEVLERYQQLRSITAAMLQSARGGNWDTLVELEEQCRSVLQPLINVASAPALSLAQREHKVQMLKQILQEDAEIRLLTSAWMGKLQQFLGTNARQRAARQFYGSAG